MKKRGRVILFAGILLAVSLFFLIYTRPLTLGQRYPALELSQCTQLRGTYTTFSAGSGSEQAQFLLYPDDPDFDKLVELLRTARFKTKPGNLLPERTTTRPLAEGDVQWRIMFQFEGLAPLPDGSMGKGDLLAVSSFYGERYEGVELSFDGETVQCSLSDQGRWSRSVTDLLTQHITDG